MGDIWMVTLGAFFGSLLFAYLVVKFSHQYGLFMDSHQVNKPQSFHHQATPRAGGIGIVFSLIFVLTVPLGWKLYISFWLGFLSGIFEDFRHSLSPRLRLFLQIIAASFIVIFGDVVVVYLGFDFTLSYDIGVLFSIFAIVGMMNAVNIIDGFNGLASGISLLMLLAFGIVAYQMQDMEIVYVVLIVIASILGFLFFNFPKGLLFLGDGGAYLLGFIVATIGISLAGHHELVSPWFVLMILIYPVWEVLFSIARKLKAGKSPFEPDSMHLHMLVFRHITHNNPLTTVVIVAFNLPFFVMSLFYANNSLANFMTTLLFIFLYVVIYYILVQKNNQTKVQKTSQPL